MPSNISKNPTSFTVEPIVSVVKEVQKYVVGMEEGIWLGCLAMLSGGHILIEGAPGTGKTVLAKNLTSAMGGEFRRIQMTPDLLPSDIVGMNVYNIGTGSWYVRKGPIFGNVVLLDELNRATPRTQAALLEAMQERHVTVGKKTYPLEEPFIVLATQNPIEQEGTYPLPEAQLDRFMFNTWVDYPSDDEYHQIIKVTTGRGLEKAQPVLTAADVIRYRQVVRRIPISDHVIDYIRRLTVATQPQRPDSPDITKRYLTWGAGPRSGQYLALGAKARALLRGNFQATCEDVRHVAYSVMRHRMFTNFVAQAEGVDTMRITGELLTAVTE